MAGHSWHLVRTRGQGSGLHRPGPPSPQAPRADCRGALFTGLPAACSTAALRRLISSAIFWSSASSSFLPDNIVG